MNAEFSRAIINLSEFILLPAFHGPAKEALLGAILGADTIIVEHLIKLPLKQPFQLIE
ncbi:hypothetical protein LMG33818_000851 [Halomonadaceae bacterium LMG 33818]